MEKTRLRKLMFYLGLVLMVFLFILFSPRTGLLEPDTYYHFAISRIISEEGLIRSLPQLENLGWDQYFPEKEFLFHQFTALAYKLGGTAGIIHFCYLLASLIIVMIIFIGESIAGRAIAVGFSLLVLMNVNLLLRLLMVRPHLAGILLALVILWGLIKNLRWPLAIAALLFPLFYHAFYLPLMFMGIFCLIERFKNIKFILTFGVLPMVVGLIINPYFPSNLAMTWLGLQIATSSSKAQNIGQEALPLGFNASMDMIGGMIVLSLAWLTQVKDMFRNNPKLLALLMITLLLECLYFFTPRTIEYLLPVFAILTVATVPYLRPKFKNYQLFLGIALLAINVKYLGYFFISNQSVKERSQDLIKLVEHLPQDRVEKVFNCEWDYGSYILFKRPSMKLVEVLDPNFIYLHDPKLAQLKHRLVFDPPKNYYSLLTDLFKSDYVMCLEPKLVYVLNSDPRFEMMAQSKTKPTTYLYKIKKD
jgi:hypothetical protein